MADDSDHDLIKRVLQGDTAAFEKLVHRHQERLFNTVFRLLGNKQDAQDVVQESFINAYQSLHTFRRDSQFFTWLYRIAYNTAVNHKRKQGGLPTNPPTLSGMAALTREDKDRIKKALDQLSAEHKAVLNYKEIDRLKYPEIAEILGVPISTVRLRLHQARLELRKVLESQTDDPDLQADTPIVLDLSKLTDAQLIAESLNDNHWAFQHLITRYQAELDGIMAELVLKRTAVTSLRPVVVAAVFTELAHFPRDMPFVSWLFQIAKRTLGQAGSSDPAA